MFDRKAYMKEYMKKYKETEKYKKRVKEYESSEKRKNAKRMRQKKNGHLYINKEKQKEAGKRYREKNRAKLSAISMYKEINEFNNVHTKCKRFIRKYNLRPNICSICGHKGIIVSHHTDYNYWNKVVFCCISCHRYIHLGVIKSPNPVNLLELSISR